jgi:hypothetical protein
LKYLKENTTFDWVDLDAAATEKAETKEDLWLYIFLVNYLHSFCNFHPWIL